MCSKQAVFTHKAESSLVYVVLSRAVIGPSIHVKFGLMMVRFKSGSCSKQPVFVQGPQCNAIYAVWLQMAVVWFAS